MNTIQTHAIQPTHTMKAPVQTQIANLSRSKNTKDSEDDRRKKTIHSGQFMTSRLHDQSPGDYLSDDEDDTIDILKEDAGYNFDEAQKDTYTTYSFGTKSSQTLAIDASLSRLFEHMTLAYSGKITSPKWKPFRGMHLRVKDKIRLNNIIWREWHMQYVFGRNPLVCHFATPLHDDVHTKPEAIVLEGYYWKRRLDTITNEYKRFRKFFKQQRPKRSSMEDLFGDNSTHALLEKVGEIHSTADFPRHQQTSHTDLILNSRDLQDMMDLSDSLFSSLNQPFAFPNPRELTGLGYGDYIQPGLVQLQPNLDDFMDFDPLTDMLGVSKSQSSLTHGDGGHTSGSARLQHGDVEMAPTLQTISQSQLVNIQVGRSSPGMSSQMMVDSPTLSSGLSEQDPMIVDTENFILNQLQILQQQKQVEDRNRQQQQHQQQQQAHQQKVLELQQKKQAENHQRLQEQQQREHQIREQRKQLELQQQQQKELQKQQELIQQQQQQQQQQQFELQQQQQKSQHLQALLQNPQLKNILTAMGENAPALLEELVKSLQAQQSQGPQSPQAQTPILAQGSPKPQTQTLVQGLAKTPAQQTLVQGLTKTQLQNSNTTLSAQSLQCQTSSGNSNIISNLLSASQQTQTQPKSLHQLLNNVSAKTRPTGKFAGNSSILAALTADEKQTALSKQTVVQPQVKVQYKAVQSASFPKKDVAGFTIPSAPFRIKGKPRVIAPAPSPQATSTITMNPSSISQQNSYLAQLLTTGTYPGALVNVKEETRLANFTAIQPAPAPQSSSQSQSSPASVSVQTVAPDFPTSLLIAAANHAFSSSSLTVRNVLQTVSSQASPSNTSMILTSSSPLKSESGVSPAQSPALSPSPSSNMFSPSSITSPVSVGTFVNSPAEDYQYTLNSPESSFTEMQVSEVPADDSGMKRSTHLSSEKKRRCNIKSPGLIQKSGFELLHSLIPSLSSNPNAKVSKAAMLQKTAEYCRKLKSERTQMQKEADILKQEISCLNTAISTCQQQLPATGVPVTRQRADQMKEMFEEYVKQRTLTNWKFWIFSLIIRNLFDSYNTMVSTASVDELCRSVLAWLDQHCSLPSLRPIAADAMRHLSTTTSILSDPARVPEQAAQAVIKRQKSTSEENNT